MKITQRNYKPIKINQETTNKRNEASIKNLETQIGKMLRKMTDHLSRKFIENNLDNSKKEYCNPHMVFTYVDTKHYKRK